MIIKHFHQVIKTIFVLMQSIHKVLNFFSTDGHDTITLIQSKHNNTIKFI